MLERALAPFPGEVIINKTDLVPGLQSAATQFLRPAIHGLVNVYITIWKITTLI